MTPEGRVKAAVKAELDKYEGQYREMPVPSGFGKSGLDFTICFFGLFLVIETKAKDGDEPTERQWERIDDIDAAGGLTVVITSVAQAKGELRELLARLHEHAASPSQREAQTHRRAILARCVKSIPRREAARL